MPIHMLKTSPEPFDATWSAVKSFEVRKNDRSFSIGDVLVLRRWNPETARYTGRVMLCTLTYLVEGKFGLPPELAVLGVGEIERFAYQRDADQAMRRFEMRQPRNSTREKALDVVRELLGIPPPEEEEAVPSLRYLHDCDVTASRVVTSLLAELLKRPEFEHMWESYDETKRSNIALACYTRVRAELAGTGRGAL